MIMRLAPVLFFFTFSFVACSGSQEATRSADSGPALNIQQPPDGSLSDEQLDTIADEIRQLEARPLASGSDQARSNLIRWITGSPDVSVTLCQGIVGPLLESESRYHSELFAQFVLSSAAYKIENPDSDPVAINAGGLRGALAAYRVMMGEEGSRAQDGFMELIAYRSESGSLAAYVRSGLAEC